MRDVLPEIERRMSLDFPDRLREWRAVVEVAKARAEAWQGDVREAHKHGSPPPLPPTETSQPEPQAPRLRQNDVTVEKVATLLATAAPKGLLIVRDEIAGWIGSMNAYHDAGRPFWIEAYGGRPYRVERQKSPVPIVVPRLAVSVYGGTQPDKIAGLLRDADDGLLSRIAWFWPEPVPFRLGKHPPASEWALTALDRLRLLDLAPGAEPDGLPRPLMVPLVESALPFMERFGQEMQKWQGESGGLMRSALGKARGLALRLGLSLEFLWWVASHDGMAPPPMAITERAFLAAATLVAEYFMPNAERVYGDAAVPIADRNATTLARWIAKERPTEVHVRQLQREVRLPGLHDAEAIHAAAKALVEAGWLQPPQSPRAPGERRREAYAVSPRLTEAANGHMG
jgi:hypothetical protein